MQCVARYQSGTNASYHPALPHKMVNIVGMYKARQLSLLHQQSCRVAAKNGECERGRASRRSRSINAASNHIRFIIDLITVINASARDAADERHP